MSIYAIQFDTVLGTKHLSTDYKEATENVIFDRVDVISLRSARQHDVTTLVATTDSFMYILKLTVSLHLPVFGYCSPTKLLYPPPLLLSLSLSLFNCIMTGFVVRVLSNVLHNHPIKAANVDSSPG